MKYQKNTNNRRFERPIEVRKSFVPPVEDGFVCELDPRRGEGYIMVARVGGGDEKVRFLYSVGMSRAVIRNGRIAFERIEAESQREPHVGLEVKLVVGMPPKSVTPITLDWCSLASWQRAEAELNKLSTAKPEEKKAEAPKAPKPAPVVPPVEDAAVPSRPYSHGCKRFERSPSGRLATVHPFPVQARAVRELGKAMDDGRKMRA